MKDSMIKTAIRNSLSLFLIELLTEMIQRGVIKVVKIITEKNLIVLKGCVPGHKNSYLAIKK